MSIILVAALLLGGELSSMRCENLLVLPGANKLEVLSRCGDPDYRERVSGAAMESEEVWIYDWPERDAQNLLRFQGITLRSIGNAVMSSGSLERSLRCGNELVHAGSSKLTVTKLCGEPALVEKTSGDDERLRETWLYDRGDVIAELRFNGVLLEDVVFRNN